MTHHVPRVEDNSAGVNNEENGSRGLLLLLLLEEEDLPRAGPTRLSRGCCPADAEAQRKFLPCLLLVLFFSCQTEK